MMPETKVTDLERFAIEHVREPHKSLLPCPTARYSLSELVVLLETPGEWRDKVLNRIVRCGFQFPDYINHPLVNIIRDWEVESRRHVEDELTCGNCLSFRQGLEPDEGGSGYCFLLPMLIMNTCQTRLGCVHGKPTFDLGALTPWHVMTATEWNLLERQLEAQ